jgi:hypothetical protein
MAIIWIIKASYLLEKSSRRPDEGTKTNNLKLFILSKHEYLELKSVFIFCLFLSISLLLPWSIDFYLFFLYCCQQDFKND